MAKVFPPHPRPPPLFEKTTLSHKYASLNAATCLPQKSDVFFLPFKIIAQVLIFPFKGLDTWTDPICSTLSLILDTLVLNGNNA